jgi:perosamine synthetase
VNLKKSIGLGGPNLGLREKTRVAKVLASGKLAQGQLVAQFEHQFSKKFDLGASVALNSGTSALHLGAIGLGIGAGDEVIVPSFTFAATANAFAIQGAKPVFCDVEKDFFTLDPNELEKLITSKTRAVVAVHLYGQLADMKSLSAICKKHNLFLIEDAAQAHGAVIDGKFAGSWGEYSAFSFYPTKNMTTGEGGMLTTFNSSLERSIRLLRNQGMIERYRNEIPGLNNRMTEIGGAIGLEQLKRLDGFNSRRIRNASFYFNELGSLAGLELPKVRSNSKHVFHQFTIKVSGDRDEFAKELKKLGVDSGIYYPTPVHELEAYRVEKHLPVTSQLAKSCLSLPIHPRLSRSDLKKVTSAVKMTLGQK